MKKNILILLFISLVLLGCSKTADYKCPDCNVILISIDTLRADHLGVYGYERNTSSYIDKLAEHSIVFENAYSQSHNTVASHASMLTSLYPHVHETTPVTKLDKKFKTLAEYFDDAGYKTAGFTSLDGWLSSDKNFDQGFDYFHCASINASTNNQLVFNWLENNSQQKFFMFIHYYDVHSEFEGEPYHTDTSFDEEFVDHHPENFTGCRKNLCASKFLANFADEVTDDELKYLMSSYDGGIAYLDNQLSFLIDKLQKLDVYNNTIIVITADHGEEFKEHGNLLHHQLYNEVLHVPLIFVIPGLDKQIRIKQQVQEVDIMPTILSLSNIKSGYLQGEPLFPVHDIDKFVMSVSLVNESYFDSFTIKNSSWSFYVRNNFTRFELYDLITDPGEHDNIFNKSSEMSDIFISKANEYYSAQKAVRKQLLSNTAAVADKPEGEKLERLRALGYLN